MKILMKNMVQMKNYMLSVFVLLLCFNVNAQELKVSVNINTPKLQTADPKVFDQLAVAIEEFMNNQKWTDDTFEEEEPIDIDSVCTQLKGIDTEIANNDQFIKKYCDELGIATPF